MKERFFNQRESGFVLKFHREELVMESGIINSLFNGFSKPQVSDDRLNENQNFEYNLEIIGHAVSSGYYVCRCCGDSSPSSRSADNSDPTSGGIDDYGRCHG